MRWGAGVTCLLLWIFVWNYLKKIFLMFIYFWRRDTQSASGGGAEREGDTESEAGSRPWAVSTEPDAGLELTNCEIVTWFEVGRLTDWATQVAYLILVLLFQFVFLSPRTRLFLTGKLPVWIIFIWMKYVKWPKVWSSFRVWSFGNPKYDHLVSPLLKTINYFLICQCYKFSFQQIIIGYPLCSRNHIYSTKQGSIVL